MTITAAPSPGLNVELNKTLAVILAGGRGSRLKQLTDHRAKPAVPIAGKFKIIDFPLSNCVNSGIRRIAVLTQYRSHTLNQHVQRGWNFLRPDFNEFIELWPAQQQTAAQTWYQGTADAVFQNMSLIYNRGFDHILVLAGDHVYKQDYSLMLQDHIDSGAVLTVGCIEVDRHEARGFGVMAIDESNNITSFVEKPAEPPEIPGKPGRCLASMGIYIFDASTIYELLDYDAENPDSSHDFGQDILPALIGKHKTIAHDFSRSCIQNPHYPDEPYWRDVGTLTAYWEANMDLTKLTPKLDLYDDGWPIRTMHYQRPAAKFIHNHDNRVGSATNSVVSAGCIVSGGSVENSILFNNVRVNSYASIENCVILPNCDIGRHCRLNKVILDVDCRVPEGTEIGFDATADAERFHRNSDGIVLVSQSMLEALG
ncbi:glucose-1-phosphate adenylyltransferase [Allohahella marinimesophila]|uniref:Glucose-1-phosphate adenylyltransferase n=1 Tax=Allohahella marinimesophila TaxID=1054972 RepID=A0ABP7Q9I7_9GAMM